VSLIHGFSATTDISLMSKLCYDRRSVGQSVLEYGNHIRPEDQILITVRQLQVCWCGALSLTRGRSVVRQSQSVVMSVVSMYNLHFTYY
jgi:hypothetical protein